MQAIQSKDTAVDPEMQQLNSMLDKVMAIQHPQTVQDKIKQQSELNKRQVFPVTVTKDVAPVSLLQNVNVDSVQMNDTVYRTTDETAHGFYSLDEHISTLDEPNTVEAVTQEEQTLVNGAAIRLRLTGDIYVKGILVPRGQLISGRVTLNGERLLVDINSIRYGSNILPVSMSAYDMDGLAGLWIPGAITRDAAKQSADQAVQSIGLTSLDPSFAAQAATAGIEAAKTIIGKKVRLIKVTVKEGYKVLLRDNRESK